MRIAILAFLLSACPSKHDDTHKAEPAVEEVKAENTEEAAEPEAVEPEPEAKEEDEPAPE